MSKVQLYPHQIKALEDTRYLKNVAYFFHMGLGKTHIASEKMLEIGNRINIVVCQKSKIDDWHDHFFDNYPNLIIINYPKHQHITTEEIILMSNHGIVVVIVNYELLWRRPELARLLEFTLILDESSMIQNPNAKVTKFIMRHLKQDATILLSGTPVGGKFENLWTQSYLLRCGLTKKEFEDKFVNFEKIEVRDMPFPIKVVSKRNPYKNVDELKSMLRNRGAIFMKTEDVIDLPEQRFIKVFHSESSSYKKFKKTKLIKIGDKELVGDTSLSYRLGLRMLASGYSQEKLNGFRDLLQSTSERLIVFYNFNHEFDALKKIADELNKPVSVVNGRERNLEAYENEEDSVTLIQYQAGAMGLNLQKADKTIYFSLPERSELFEQSKKRIHRIGQTRPCTYYLMLTRDSIDEHIYRALEQKRDYTDELFREEF